MRTLSIILALLFVASPTFAKVPVKWTCNPPLTTLDMTPPVRLRLENNGAFRAKGPIVFGIHSSTPIAWTGQWAEYDNGFALIGAVARVSNDETSGLGIEARGFATEPERNTMFLRVVIPDQPDVNYRCLTFSMD